MRIKITLQLKKRELPLDWRRPSLSFFKSVLQQESKALFDYYYGSGEAKMKPFTFWAALPEAIFKGEKISLKGETITLSFSSKDTKLMFYMYNGFQKRKGKPYPLEGENHMVPINVRIVEEKQVQDNEIIVNMLSPLVVRKHQKGERDRYLLPNENGFEQVLDGCVNRQVSILNHCVRLEAIKTKKVVVKSWGANIPASLGVFKLSGDPRALDELFQNGIGAKSSAGFGKFEVIN